MGTAYGHVLSLPGAAAFSATAVVSRLPISMAALGIVLLVSESTGSYADAGLVSASYVLAAAAFAPVQGRLTDRFGQGAVLLVVGALFGVGTALTITAITGEWGAPWPHLAAALAGLSTPQTGSMVRTRWTHALADDRPRLGTAFALEAVLDEVVFIVGPVLVTFLTLQVAAPAGLATAGVAATLGSWALAAQRSTEPPRSVHRDTPREPMGWGVLGPVLVASLGIGCLFGSTEVLVVAFTSEEGRRGAAGVVLAVWAAGSLAAGLVVGATRSPEDPVVRLRWTLLVLSLLFVPLLVAPDVVWFTVGMFAAGVMISPTMIAALSIIELHVAPSRLTEALTWTSTGLSAGVAPGAAGAGWVVDHHGASTGFLVPLVAGLVATAVAWSFHPRPAPDRDLLTAPPTH